MRFFLPGFFALVILLAGCNRRPVAVRRAFYFWKSGSYSLSEGEQRLRSDLGAARLYVKMFEVERHPVLGPVPVAKNRFYEVPDYTDTTTPGQDLVPTVYVQDNVFGGLSPVGIDSLADNIVFLTRKRLDAMRLSYRPGRELQIDCDWTAAHKTAYFRLLRRVRARWRGPISCTLRLYPFKYRERMGVPPVDRAMLMCYNLLRPLGHPDRNTILEPGELRGYLGRQRPYPLPLDVALPVYSRLHWYQNGQYLRTLDDVEAIRPLLRATRPLWYEVTADSTVCSAYLRRGDAVKLEEIPPETLYATATLLREKLRLPDTVNVALFHLDESLLKHYGHDTLDRIYASFTR